MAAKIRNALALYGPLCAAGHAEIRLHRTVLYDSIYRADERIIVNLHAHGVPAADAPVVHIHQSAGNDMFASYLASFERVWQTSAPLGL
jgi:hypothetical protein